MKGSFLPSERTNTLKFHSQILTLRLHFFLLCSTGCFGFFSFNHWKKNGEDSQAIRGNDNSAKTSVLLSDLYHLENLMICWKKYYPGVCRALEKAGGEKRHCRGIWQQQTSPAASLHNPFFIKQTRVYRMDTGLCSKSSAPCHTELLDVPKSTCQISPTDMVPAGREVHHIYLWSLSWGLQWAHWMQKGMGYPLHGAVLFLKCRCNQYYWIWEPHYKTSTFTSEVPGYVNKVARWMGCLGLSW